MAPEAYGLKHTLVIPEVTESPLVYLNTTPNGTTVEFSPYPKRYYAVNGEVVPSVTTVLGVLDKSGPLMWWAQGIGVQGTLDLIDEGIICRVGGHAALAVAPWPRATSENVVPLLTEHKKTCNHQRDKAADRGTNVHRAMELWATDGLVPDITLYPEAEQGYVRALLAFIADVRVSKREPVLSEVRVGSVEHGYAGTADLRLLLNKCDLCVNSKKQQYKTFDSGTRVMLDAKTRKKLGSLYETEHLQLAAYEAAAVENGYPPTTHRLILQLSPDGLYEVRATHGELRDFLAVKDAYDAVKRIKETKNAS